MNLKIGLLILLCSLQANAITLLDKEDWKILLTGFLETDITRDTTRSFSEVIGNAPVLRSGTLGGDNGQLAFSNRNSRLAFTFLPPVEDNWKSKGYIEFDFLGYDPSVSSTNTPSQTESAFYANPAIRIRHAYVSLDNSQWLWLVGQTWSVFGWEPTYVLATVSVAPVSASLYQRTEQAMMAETTNFAENHKVQWALSLERPSQRDSGTPNVDVGAKYSYSGRKSGYASPLGDINAEPLSFAISATMKQFSTGQASGTNQTHTSSSAVAADLMLPLLSSEGQDVSNSLTFTAEVSAGSGYADTLPSWSGSLKQLPNGTGSASNTDLDPGQGGFDGNGNFQLVSLQTFTTQLQYHFLKSYGAFATLGYAQVNAWNMTQMANSPFSTVAYNEDQVSFINFVKDITTHIRVAAEYDHVVTTYVDGMTPADDRYQVTAYFRF